MKRLIAIFLSVLIVSSTIPNVNLIAEATFSPPGPFSSVYTNSEYYTKLCNVNISGDYFRDIVSIASSQVGYHEGNSTSDYDGKNNSGIKDYTEYGRWAGNNASWCGFFVTWCAHQAGIPDDVIISSSTNKNRGNGGLMHTYYSNLGTYYTLNASTMNLIDYGDVVLIKYGSDLYSHIGLVESVDRSSNTIHTIEGNCNEKVVRTSRKYGSADGNITGFIHPDRVNYLSNVTNINTYMILNTDNVPVHATPAASGTVTTHLPKGSVVHFSQKGINSAGNVWYKIGTGIGRFDDVPGYIYGEYISVMPTSGTYQIQPDMTTNIALRQSASASAASVGSIPPNGIFTISNASGEWAYANYNGKVGWMRIGYAKYIGEAARHTHSYGAWTTSKAATCTEKGTEKRSCSCGETEIRTISALGHSYTSTVVAPTCTEKGYTKHTCSHCGDIYVDTYVNAAGHKWDNGTVTKAATCTAAGTKKFTCTSCGETKTETTSALGHSYTSTVVAPTCTEKGYTKHTCSHCGDIYVDTYVNAAGHKWDNGTVTKAATCTAAGTKKFTCTSCEETKTETISALGHSYTSTVVAPTCTEKGYTKHTCSHCGDIYVDTYVNAAGHKWDNGTVTKAATTEAEGMITYKCTKCTATKTETIPKLKENMTASVSAASASCGQEFTVKINLKNIDGIYSFGIWQGFDNTVFEFVSAKTLLSDAALFEASEKDGVIAAFSDVKATGDVAELTFRVKNTAKAGDYVFTYECVAEDSSHDNHKVVISGKVSVASYLRGDVNGDGKINSADSIYMLRHSMLGTRYPINQNGDMNGDGKVNSVDAIYLLRHSMMPGRYPLS